MKQIVSFLCTFLFSLPFLVLILARIITFFAIDVNQIAINLAESICNSKIAQHASENSEVGKQVVLFTRNFPVALKEFLQEDSCQLYGQLDQFQGLKLLRLHEESFLDIQRGIYKLAQKSIEDHHNHRIFAPNTVKENNASHHNLIEYYKFASPSSSEASVELWETIHTKNNSIIQAAQIYDEKNINNEDHLDDTLPVKERRNQQEKRKCAKAYRAAMVHRSDSSLQEIFFLLASWQGINAFFLTKSWQDLSHDFRRRPIFSYEWYNGTIDLLFVPIYSSPLSRSHTIVFQSFYPGQLVKEDADEYLLSLIISYLKSHDHYYTLFEDRFDQRDAFYEVSVGLTISEIEHSSKISAPGNGSHAYLIELVRFSANPNYLFSAVNRQIDSNLFFSYFQHQLTRLLR